MAEEKKKLSDDDRKELSGMLVNINRNANGLVAYDLEYKPLPEEKMTPAQRLAIKNFTAIMFPKEVPAAEEPESKK